MLKLSDIPKSNLQACDLIDGHEKLQPLGKPQGCSIFEDYADVFVYVFIDNDILENILGFHALTGCGKK